MEYNQSNLNLIIKRANAGNKKAFEEIFNIHYRSLCYFSYKITNDFETSKDIVQELFITIWDKDLKFENANTLKAYLYNSVKNRSISFLEVTNNRHILNKKLIITDKDEDTFVQQQIEAEVISDIYKAIDELPEECKKIFKLSYIKYYKNQEIADHLNISITTVKTQKARAKKQLKEKLKNVYPLLFFIFLN